MLPKKNRLSRKDIDTLKSLKKPVIQRRFFGLVFSPSSFSKFALILSKKLLSKANQRNRFRRIFFDKIFEIKPTKLGSYLFLAKKGLMEADLPEIKEDIIRLCQSVR